MLKYDIQIIYNKGQNHAKKLYQKSHKSIDFFKNKKIQKIKKIKNVNLLKIKKMRKSKNV